MMPGRVGCLVVGFRWLPQVIPPVEVRESEGHRGRREGRAGPLSGFRAGAVAGAIESRRGVTRVSGREAAR